MCSKLDINEFQRAFRALGLKKRSGEKMQIDQAMFNAFDSNGDGVVTLAELEANLFIGTRQKIEDKLDEGWRFDKKRWAESTARHAKLSKRGGCQPAGRAGGLGGDDLI